jgi:hypothetical protein
MVLRSRKLLQAHSDHLDNCLASATVPKHLGARIGLTAELHTWGSALTHHPHAHIIVPGSGFSPVTGRRPKTPKETRTFNTGFLRGANQFLSSPTTGPSKRRFATFETAKEPLSETNGKRGPHGSGPETVQIGQPSYPHGCRFTPGRDKLG